MLMKVVHSTERSNSFERELHVFYDCCSPLFHWKELFLVLSPIVPLSSDAQCEEVKHTGIKNPSIGVRMLSQNSDILLWTLMKIFYTVYPFENCVIHLSVLLFLPVSYLKRLQRLVVAFRAVFVQLLHNVRVQYTGIEWQGLSSMCTQNFEPK